MPLRYQERASANDVNDNCPSLCDLGKQPWRICKIPLSEALLVELGFSQKVSRFGAFN
jgi:hypothetical protein